MKKLLIVPILFLAILCHAQSPCLQINCSDSLAFTQTTDTLMSQVTGFTPTKTEWKIIYGPGSISGTNSANASIKGLKPGTSTFIAFMASAGNLSSIAYKVITVAPVPLVVKQRSVVSFSGKFVNGVFVPAFVYDDGSTQ